MGLPNLYLVGAPKAGTSSLFDYLASHDEVFRPFRKELNHRGDDLAYRKRLPAARYAAAYEKWVDEQYAIDGTVFALLSWSAAAEIHRDRPDAKIIAILREPVDAVISLHHQLLLSGDEDRADLGEALALAPARARGEHVPPLADHPHALQYLDVVDYAGQIERYYATFGRAAVHIEIMDDLRADPGALYRRCLAFLGLADDGRDDFAVRNVATAVRSHRARDLVRRPPAPIRRMGRAVLRTPALRRAARRTAHAAVLRVNRVEAAPSPVDEAVRDDLRAQLSQRVAPLEALLERDLAGWRAG